MGISGRIVNGVMLVRCKGVDYLLTGSNATAVEAYLHTGDEAYLLALATEEELQHYA